MILLQRKVTYEEEKEWNHHNEEKIAINERKIILPIHFQNSGPGPENA